MLRPIVFVSLLAITCNVAAQRIKDMTDVSGVRSNQLVGYGLVVGLDGTGDQTSQTPFTIQTFRNMLQQLGIQMPLNATFQLKNVAAVAVQAVWFVAKSTPPYAGASPCY